MLLVISTFEQETAKGGLAMPGCQEKCGNLTIPYPFGIGKPGCYLDEPFRVNCNSSTQVATLPYFLNVTIYNISSDSIIINAYGSSVVYNSSSGKNMEKGDVETVGYELLQPHFSISHTKNKFVALGCDIFSFLKDFRTGSIITGCASFCVNKDRLESQPNFSSCSGYGCCQTPIQTKLGDYFVSGAHTMNTDNTTWSRNRCNYIMIVEKSFDKFDEIKCRPDFTIPSAVDWSIGNLSCAKAKERICGHNAYCDKSTREGYLCRCSHGYQGNPYLPSGCQGVGVGISILIFVVAGFWLNRKLKKMKLEKTKERFFKRNGGFLLQKQMPTSNRGSVLEMKIFKTEELEKATDNFNQSRILGKGGLGTVYKGMLSDGCIVAVKKSNKVNEGHLNDKSDVYAFGVVLAELLTGQKVISSNTSDEGLAIRFKTSLKQKDGLFEILDRAVANEGGEEEIFVVAKLAKRCIKLNARKRPGMMEVATELQRLARTNGEDLQRRPNGFEDSYFSSSAMSFDYSSGPISFDYNLDLSTDKTL
nr:wall-associated receptor kinase 2-like [Ipomoea trifida]